MSVAHLRLTESAMDRCATAGIEHLLTASEVARILGVRSKRVYELGLPEVRISERAIRYRPADLARWIEERGCNR